ncbi:MAG: hypothetical protein ACKOJ7_01795 [Betaproteobacteria bacterium]
MNRYTDYYLADADGYFLSGLSLLPEEAERYQSLLTVRPPDRPAPVIDREAERLAVAKAYAIRSINDQREQASQANLFYEGIEVQADTTWKHGLIAGFMFAAVATLVALASGAFPTHPTSVGHEAIEGLITYAQLSVVCLSVYFVRRLKNV